MSTASVPYRFQHELRVHGTPQQVWQAIATARGLTAWMLPTELDPRLGGRVRFEMGPGQSSEGEITAFEDNRRIAYDEDWATLAGHPGADVTPLATEFLIEAESGGTCVIRVVSSAYGTGAEWENEFWSGMDQAWEPMLDHLRTYLAHFAKQHASTDASTDSAWVELAASPSDVIGRARAALGLPSVGADVGSAVDGAGLRGSVDRLGTGNLTVLVDSPFDGFVALATLHEPGDTPTTLAMVHTYSFGEAADIDWQQWLETLTKDSHG